MHWTNPRHSVEFSVFQTKMRNKMMSCLALQANYSKQESILPCFELCRVLKKRRCFCSLVFLMTRLHDTDTQVRAGNTWWSRRSPVLLLRLPLPSQTTSQYSLEPATDTHTNTTSASPDVGSEVDDWNILITSSSLTMGAPLCPMSFGAGPSVPASLMQGEYIPRGTR